MTEQTVEEKVQEREALRRARDLQAVLDTEHGRRFLFRLILETRTFESSFTGNSMSFYNDGRKSVGLDLFHEVMELDPVLFQQMWTEHKEAEALVNAQLDESRED